MAKRKTTKKKVAPRESDGVYFLKIALYLMLSSMWLRIQWESGTELPIPIGALTALVFVSHEHFQIDRKVEFALILLGMFVSFWLPIGVYLSL